MKVSCLLDALGKDSTVEESCSVLGIGRSEFCALMMNPDAELDPYKADTFAIRMNLHPFNIWGWDWVFSD